MKTSSYRLLTHKTGEELRNRLVTIVLCALAQRGDVGITWTWRDRHMTTRVTRSRWLRCGNIKPRAFCGVIHEQPGILISEDPTA